MKTPKISLIPVLNPIVHICFLNVDWESYLTKKAFCLLLRILQVTLFMAKLSLTWPSKSRPSVLWRTIKGDLNLLAESKQIVYCSPKLFRIHHAALSASPLNSTEPVPSAVKSAQAVTWLSLLHTHKWGSFSSRALPFSKLLFLNSKLNFSFSII